MSQRTGGGTCPGCRLRPGSEDSGHYLQPPEFTARLFSKCLQLPAAWTVVELRQGSLGQGATQAGAPRPPPHRAHPLASFLGHVVLQVGPFVSLLLFPVGPHGVHTFRFRRRCEALQDATFLPANSPALRDSEELRAGWGPTPRVRPITSFCFKWPIVRRDKAAATLVHGYQAVFWKLVPRTGWGRPAAGSWHREARRPWNGAQNHSDIFYSFPLFLKSGAQIISTAASKYEKS